MAPSYIGLAALLLLIVFGLRNLYVGTVIVRLFPKSDPSAAATRGLVRPPSDEKKAKNELLFAHIHNWYILLVLLLAAALLILTPPGRDVINYLTETLGWLQLATVLLAQLLFSISIWIVPWHLLDQKSRGMLRYESTQLDMLRILGLMAYVMIFVAIAAASDEDGNSLGYFLGIIAIYAIYWLMRSIIKTAQKEAAGDLEKVLSPVALTNNLYWTFLLGGAAICFYSVLDDDNSNQKIGLLAACLGLALFYWSVTIAFEEYKSEDEVKKLGLFAKSTVWLSNLIGNVLEWMDRHVNGFFLRIFKPIGIEQTEPPERLRRNRMCFRLLIWTNIGWTFLMCFLPNLMPIPPLAIVFSGFGFLLTLIDVLYYTGTRLRANDTSNETPRSERLHFLNGKMSQNFIKNELTIFAVLVVGLIFLLFSADTSNAEVLLATREKAPPPRIRFDEYFEKWAEARRGEILKNDSLETYPVFIFAGQGGGSRAGFWTAENLTFLDSAMQNFDLCEHTLAISTVSGSSPGTVAALAWWETEAAKRPAPFDFGHQIFKRNFITASLAGNFHADLAARCVSSFCKIKDRNRRLISEESWAIQNALENKNGKGRFWGLFENLENDGHFANQPFSNLYVKNDGWRVDLPLFLPNSAHVETGQRTVISPVIDLKREQNHVHNVLDLVGALQVLHPKKELTIGQASNLTELFPYISAAAHIDGAGDFVDGGYFENFGLTTALEVYRAAVDWQNSEKAPVLAKKLRFYVIALINSVDEKRDDDYQKPIDSLENRLDKARVNQYLAPPTAIYNTAFGGHANTKRSEARGCLKLDSSYFEIVLDKKNLPLTRVLTFKNLEDLRLAIEKQTRPFLKRFNPAVKKE